MELLPRLKIRLGIKETDHTSDALLEDILLSAKAAYAYLRYPVGPAPFDDTGVPIVEPRYEDWVLRAAIEIYSRQGGEGQTAHSENGVSRTYEAGTLSNTLRREVVPFVGVVAK